MFENRRDILPVAIKDIEQRIENEEDILSTIDQSLEDLEGLSESGRIELSEERDKVERSLKSLALQLTVRFEIAA